MPDQLTNIVSYKLGDEQVDVDLYDIDGVEWRDMRLVGGLSRDEIIQGMGLLDFEAIALLVWTWKRRTDPTLDYVEMLRSLDMKFLIASSATEEPTDPPV